MIWRRLINWIDRTYSSPATSNNAMGVILSVLGVIALSIDSDGIRVVIFFLMAGVLAVFGWRMIVWSKRFLRGHERNAKNKVKGRTNA